MAIYNAPDVYVEDVSVANQSIEANSNLTGVMLGALRSGPIDKVVLVTSWAEFLEQFAHGLSTAFVSGSLLPDAIYGYFANGGNSLYVVRVASASAAAAKIEDADGISLYAKYKGNNPVSVKFTKNEDWTAQNKLFDVKVTTEGSEYEVKEVTKETLIAKLSKDDDIPLILDVDLITMDDNWDIAEGTHTLVGGNDGITGLTDAMFIASLDVVTSLDDAVMLAIPGQTSTALNTAVMTFCDAHYIHPFLDMPVGSTVTATRTYRKGISAHGGSLHYPWNKVADPLNDGQTKNVPTCGHIMGITTRMCAAQGLAKVPAGIAATVNGVLGQERDIQMTDVDKLNPVGVDCIVNRRNYGLVGWGARSLNDTDEDMRYISDILINYVFRRDLYNGTQFAVFEINNEALWSRITNVITAYLEARRQQGVLKGNPNEAYRVVCDSTNNTETTIKQGKLIVDVAYAANKPAEFVIIHLAHTMQS